ncbi:HD domain-containing protein [Butyrivibrio sp. WCD3002]|uniref:HD-GYP domain-containing protein n=1 Tax=Butyrivibrio sp. WCD3002 TaxID=1280676 RepID=UPI001A99CBAF
MCWEMDQQVMSDLSFAKWKDTLIARSEIMRKIYLENEKFLADLKKELESEISPEFYEQLFNTVKLLYDGGYDDLFIMRTIVNRILPYFEEKKDYPKILFLRKVIAYEHYEFYGRLSHEEGMDKALELYEKTIELKEYYAELTDRADRRAIFVCYSNLVAILANEKEDTSEKIFKYIDEGLRFWQTDVVQRIDGNDTEFNERMDRLETEILYAIDASKMKDEELRDEYIGLVHRLKKKIDNDGLPDTDGGLFRAEIKCRLLENESEEALIEELIAHIDGLGELDYDDGDVALEKLLDYHNSGCEIFDIIEKSENRQKLEDKFIPRFVSKITDIHAHIPFGFWTGVVDDACAEWFSNAAPYDKNPARKAEMLLKLVISRQPITYIHSLMVGEIAARITISLIKSNPSFFIGILDMKDENQVKSSQEELCDYATKAALLHDCGKCEIVEVVNRQHRHLYKEEYSVIQLHPDKGYEMLQHDPAFDKYFDIIRGHHKSYDGKSGYPANFNNVKSKLKPMIDLITIADCIDAATDILGRNYVKSKDFNTIYNELIAGSGTMYNPEIVELIGSDKSLYQDLLYLTGEGRFEVYYRAYREIILR